MKGEEYEREADENRMITKSHQTRNTSPATQRISPIDVARRDTAAVLIIAVARISIRMVIM